MKLPTGVKLIDERPGMGDPAVRGDTVEFESQGFLSRGECIRNQVSCATRLGSRRVIAGIEYALIGMQVGGYRKVKISPHLAYRDRGLVDKIPPKAVLIYELWLKKIEPVGVQCISRCGEPGDQTATPSS